ncbi:AsmA family protein [Pantoea coffeiphila]|uniref:AsmA family protein n=1 Tax=Pantoea coffeiphila TaxID=1465635 RepID=A0A2S9I7V6_9GAMM|nr:AsmA family protein [Pantoea coffeiphila]PRD13804.1 AsmA family protein [Pantoea coffeiphila]
MKFLGKVLLTLLLVLLLVIVAFYVLLQTQWGAGWISRQISDDSAYQLSMSKIEHDFSNPSHLLLDNVAFGRDGQPATLVAKRVDLGLSLKQFSNPLHFSSIRLNQGTLNLDNGNPPVSLQADRLQLSQMALNRSQDNWSVQAQRVDGGIIPWQPEATERPDYQASFQISAGSLLLNGVPAANALIEGNVKGREWTISNLGADVARGSATANARRDAAGNWQVSSLRLNSIRLQSDKTLSDFLQPLLSLPEVRLGRVDVTDARLEGRDWAVTDLDLVLKNITLSHGDWQSDGGSLAMNASSVVNGSLQLDDPIANLDFSPQGIELSQFSSRWVNGLIRAQGSWNRSDKKLSLDEVVIAGLEYTLPSTWRERWTQALPGWLDSVEIKKFSANRNLIIDIDPAFPFQMTSLEGTGNNLLLAHNHQWGIWSGNMSLNAAEATFNRVDLRHPSLTLAADGNSINFTEMSAFSGDGMLEGNAKISQQPDRSTSFTLNGRQVAFNLLQNWGWSPLPQSKGNLQLSGQALLQQDKPLKPTVNATLSVTSADNAVQQRMVNGEVRSGN